MNRHRGNLPQSAKSVQKSWEPDILTFGRDVFVDEFWLMMMVIDAVLLII